MSVFVFPKNYDVIVVGAGHAGIEAALSAARMGCSTLLMTINADTIGQMSCNPAIGGLAKGHLVREIDALGGEMGKATDMTGIQFRMLNRARGPAVWAPRAQCDKKAYQFRLKWICEMQPNLDVKQGHTTKILTKDQEVCGIQTTINVRFHSRVVIITTGTFLRGLLHVGSNSQEGGRAGESSTTHLSQSLKEIGLELGRLKTGTPPRLLRRSIDFSKTSVQNGDYPIPFFTHWKDDLFHVEQDRKSRLEDSSPSPSYPQDSMLARINGQLPCFLTTTTEETAELIKRNLHKSPMYSGVIEGTGPRYCPSIEDKIVKFADKERHQIFLEPEGVATDEIYVNGLSTCLPFDVQWELVRSIVGCENAEIIRPAYAVEYDFAYPTQLRATLETKACRNLYLAGQINGTSGYEEAAAQGLMAGINAAQKVKGNAEIVLGRDQAYIGVLIDDLVTKGTSEPYRMFTSRAEYRLLLRQDNADMRLSRLGYEIGLLPERNFLRFEKKENEIREEIKRLTETRQGSVPLTQMLRRPGISYKELPTRNPSLSTEVTEQVEIGIKYSGYIERQEFEIGRAKSLEKKKIPMNFDYSTIQSLSKEARQKLANLQPATIGQASRISGVTPADIGILIVHLKRNGSAPSENR